MASDPLKCPENGPPGLPLTFLFEAIPMCYGFVVNTLAEIEAAVESLPPHKKEELLRFIVARLRDEISPPSQRVEWSRSRRGFPISKGRLPFSSADVARIESQSDAIEKCRSWALLA